VSEVATSKPCPTCGQDRPAEDFYTSSRECKPCKRARSRRNRADAARKLALAEKAIDVLADLARQGWQPHHCVARRRPTTDRNAIRPAS
jgi:phosphoglycolate phosphatase-like HAD superfamily hydrolase